jgi:hypothetical protein
MIASSYKLTAMLFGTGVTLHNLEEAMLLVDWSRSHLKLWFEPNPKIYWVLTSLVSVVIWIPVVWRLRFEGEFLFSKRPLRICSRHGNQCRAAPLHDQPG